MTDERQKLIVAQNAMGHAVKILIHNVPEDKVKVSDVVKAAEIITAELLRISREVE